MNSCYCDVNVVNSEEKEVPNNTEKCKNVDDYMNFEFVVNAKLGPRQLESVRNAVKYHIKKQKSEEEIIEALLTWFTEEE